MHGTAGWSYKDWVGPFYPEGAAAGKYLELYAKRFPGVEVDSTFYRTPSRKSVEAWSRAVPEGFLFSPKMVRDVTHDKFLRAARDEAGRFLDALAPLGPKLGRVILQFPYFKKAEGIALDVFLARLLPFLDAADDPARFAVEVRNKTFLKPALLGALRDRKVALVLNDHPWMPAPEAWAKIPGVFTAATVPLRLLGDRYGIEKITKTWGAVVVDQRTRLKAWAKVAGEALGKDLRVTAFVNNHFAGHAPASAEDLAKLVRKQAGLR